MHTVLRSGRWGGGGGDVSAQGGLCLGDVYQRGVCLGGVCPGGNVCPGRVYTSPCEQNDRQV